MIRQLIPEEFCLKCPGCCRFPQTDSAWSPNLSDEDIEELLKNKIPPLFILDNKKIRLTYIQKQNNFACSFFDSANNKCKVYSYRPLECQLYPFLLNRRKNQVFLAVDLRCPFAKENQNTKILKEYTDYLIGFLNSPDSLNVLRNNPRIIQAYDPVVDLAVINI
jgi:Fe-S-cluster containining protein